MEKEALLQMRCSFPSSSPSCIFEFIYKLPWTYFSIRRANEQGARRKIKFCHKIMRLLQPRRALFQGTAVYLLLSDVWSKAGTGTMLGNRSDAIVLILWTVPFNHCHIAVLFVRQDVRRGAICLAHLFALDALLVLLYVALGILHPGLGRLF